MADYKTDPKAPGGVRLMTTKEQAEYDNFKARNAIEESAIISGEPARDFDGNTALNAVAIYFAGLHGITFSKARTDILAIYQTLRGL